MTILVHDHGCTMIVIVSCMMVVEIIMQWSRNGLHDRHVIEALPQ